jgi:hypothetical protein
MMQGKTDKEIMKQLGLTKPTFNRFRHRVITEADQAFQKQRLETLAFHKELLQERLTRLLRAAMQIKNSPTKNFKTAEIAATTIIDGEIKVVGIPDFPWIRGEDLYKKLKRERP